MRRECRWYHSHNHILGTKVWLRLWLGLRKVQIKDPEHLTESIFYCWDQKSFSEKSTRVNPGMDGSHDKQSFARKRLA